MNTEFINEKPNNNLYYLGFLFFTFLAVFHFPVFELGTTADSIGIFDVALAVFFFCLCIFNAPYRIHNRIKSLVYVLLIFLFYITISFLLSHLYSGFSFFAFALLIKQYQYLAIGVVFFFFIDKLDRYRIHIALYLIVVPTTANGIYMIFYKHLWHRLGLISTLGTSSNPAGFILGICLLLLLVLFFDKEYRRRMNLFLFWLVYLIGIGGLLLTVSRTNNIAFILVLFLYFVVKYKVKAVNFLILFVFLSVFAYLLFQTSALFKGRILPIQYILNPSLIFQDASFGMRVASVWFSNYKEWSANFFTMIFGIGFGNVRLSDGLFPTVLYSTGLAGVFIYYGMFVYLYLKAKMELKIIIIFVLINSISTETTINSFRAMQVFLIPFVYMLKHYFQDNDTNLVDPLVLVPANTGK